MNVQQFECKNNHLFFIPIPLRQDLYEVADLLNKVECPLCHCKSEDIKLNARKYRVTMDLHIGEVGQFEGFEEF